MQHQIEWVYVLIGVGMVIVGLAVAAILFARFAMSSKRVGQRTFQHAIKLAKCRWYFKEKVLLQGGIGIELFSEGGTRQKLFIPFRPGHPDISIIESLEHMDIIEFEVQEESMECALVSELCGYLRVKKVGHFA